MAATNAVIGGSNPGVTWTIQNANSAQGGRYHDLALLMEGSTTNMSKCRPGCFVGPWDNTASVTSCWLVEPAGALTCTVRAGAAVVERNTLVGPYGVVSEGSVTIGFATADATNPRIDRVDLQVLDGALGDNGGVSQTALVVTTGVASGTPALPSAPANSIPIAKLTLPAGTSTITSGMLTMIRKSAAVRGTIRTLLEGDSLADPGFMVGELRDTSLLGVASIDRWGAAGATWIRVADLTGASAQSAEFTAALTVSPITASTYADVVSSSTKIGTTFIAPASGIVRIGWGCNGFSGLSGSSMLVSTAVATGGTIGSGTTQSAANDDDALVFSLLGDAPGDRYRYLSGLTAGSTYNTWIRAHNSGSTSSHIDRPFIEVTPVLR